MYILCSTFANFCSCLISTAENLSKNYKRNQQTQID